MEKDIIFTYENNNQNIKELTQQIEVIFTIIEELKNVTFKQDLEIQTISDIITQSKETETEVEKNLEESNKYLIKKRLLLGIGLSGLIYYSNVYILITGIISGTYYYYKN